MPVNVLVTLPMRVWSAVVRAAPVAVSATPTAVRYSIRPGTEIPTIAPGTPISDTLAAIASSNRAESSPGSAPAGADIAPAGPMNSAATSAMTLRRLRMRPRSGSTRRPARSISAA